LPGEEDVETEVPCTMGGTDESCLLDDEDERWSSREEFSESDSCVLLSRIPRYFERAACVLRILASLAAESADEKLLRSFFASNNLMKSCRFLSSSLCSSDPELPCRCGDSVIKSEPPVGCPCCADEDALAFPLLFWSSSPLLPVDEKRLLRWLKELL
jgi:hypothetical protein